MIEFKKKKKKEETILCEIAKADHQCVEVKLIRRQIHVNFNRYVDVKMCWEIEFTVF